MVEFIYTHGWRERTVVGPLTRMFGHTMNIPDEYGAVTHAHRHGNRIVVVCEHGVHFHTIPVPDDRRAMAEMMKNKGKAARRINAARKATRVTGATGNDNQCDTKQSHTILNGARLRSLADFIPRGRARGRMARS